MWHRLHQTLLATLQTGQKASLSLKILRKLVIHGLKRPHEHGEAMLFVEKLFMESKNLLHVRKSFGAGAAAAGAGQRKPLEKYIVIHLKIWSELLENHPYSFVNHIW